MDRKTVKLSHIVPDSVQAVSLARYLSRAYPMLPGWALREALKARDVRLNGRRAGGGEAVSGGMEIVIYAPEKCARRELHFLYRDEHMAALVKPRGLPVDADAGGVGEDTLLSRLRERFPAARLAHRLDAGTGGVLLAAMDEFGYDALVGAFREGRVDKRYRAICAGAPPREAARLATYLRKDAAAARVVPCLAGAPGALFSALSYKLLNREGELSELAIALETGRTHQIRVQLAGIGCPVLGDDKYGDREANRRRGAKQTYLWCERIGLCGGPFDGRVFAAEPEWRKPWQSE